MEDIRVVYNIRTAKNKRSPSSSLNGQTQYLYIPHTCWMLRFNLELHRCVCACAACNTRVYMHLPKRDVYRVFGPPHRVNPSLFLRFLSPLMCIKSIPTHDFVPKRFISFRKHTHTHTRTRGFPSFHLAEHCWRGWSATCTYTPNLPTRPRAILYDIMVKTTTEQLDFETLFSFRSYWCCSFHWMKYYMYNFAVNNRFRSPTMTSS